MLQRWKLRHFRLPDSGLVMELPPRVLFLKDNPLEVPKVFDPTPGSIAKVMHILIRHLSLALFILGAAAAWNVPDEYAISPSPDGRFLRDASGEPFFWQADTAWLLFHRLNFTDAEQYLSHRASKGFTMVLAVGFTQEGITNPNREGNLPFIDEDVTQPNELYWAYVDTIVELAWAKGLRICMVPAWGNYVHDSANNPGVLNASAASTFGHFIGQRYPYLPKTLVADTNPLWLNKTAVKADYTAGGVPPTYVSLDWSPVYNALADGIVSGEHDAISATHNSSVSQTWTPLLTIHPTNQWFNPGPPALASAFFGNSTWLTLDTSQSGHADFPPNPPIPWWNARRGWEPVERMWASGGRPAVDNEAHYEGRYDNGNSALPPWNASDVRTGSWQAVFSGAAGLTYGANAVMQFAIPGVYAPDGTGPGDNWLTDLELPGSGQMQFVQKAVRDRGNASYFQRVPAQDIIVGDAGTDDKRVTATRDAAGGWVMVYTPTGKSFTINTGTLVSCDNAQASWFSVGRTLHLTLIVGPLRFRLHRQ
ncbi:hypothetical protein D9757_005508 [Collybiopsis confluens]|uniref:DUF4038 domain-containing protein n=1 Tax=Collybiopsis confluens TaxID=2823264 RepID=A0A8H5HLZ1_9AGAR|nr:hypothetical protein D9757_005508 [Collybiopsis confluens]